MTTIEQYLDDKTHEGQGVTLVTAARLRDAENALRAVAERHEPRGEGEARPGFTWCAGCSRGYVFVQFPCPELDAIHAALGIDGKEES